MGRPVKGARLGATGAATATIPVRAKIGAAVNFEGFIVRQVGSRRYRVSNDGGSVVGNATLTDKVTGHSAGECSIVGFVNGSATTCAKLTNRVFTDFSDNKYTYALSDDSAESLMILTAI